MSISYGLSESQRALHVAGRPVYAHSLSNAASGSIADANQLIRVGLWEIRHIHFDPDGYYREVMGPKGRKWWPAVEYPQ